MQLLNRLAIYFSITLLLLASPLVIAQAFLVNRVFVSSADVKLAINLVFVLLIILNQFFATKKPLKSYLTCLLFFIFIVYNAYQIIYNSSMAWLGISDAIGAFCYNYSVLIFIVPFYLLASFADFNDSRRKRVILFIFVMFFLVIDIFAILQFINNSYLLPDNVISVLTAGDYIKFDQFHDHIRPMALLKSPLELGILNVFASLFFLAKFKHGNKTVNLFLFILATITIFSTLSRTAILMYVTSVLIFIFLLFTQNNRQKIIVKIFMVFLILILTLTAVCFFGALTQVALFDPKNLLIRLANWSDLFSNYLQNAAALFFGSGIVQNAAYGAYHSIVIDNTYIGIMLTGGVFSLLMFVAFVIVMVMMNFSYLNKLRGINQTFGIAYFAFFIGFLFGGFTENLMHLFFYAFYPFVFISMLSFPKIDLVGGQTPMDRKVKIN
jgi:hypothetical protein